MNTFKITEMNLTELNENDLKKTNGGIVEILLGQLVGTALLIGPYLLGHYHGSLVRDNVVNFPSIPSNVNNFARI